MGTMKNNGTQTIKELTFSQVLQSKKYGQNGANKEKKIIDMNTKKLFKELKEKPVIFKTVNFYARKTAKIPMIENKEDEKEQTVKDSMQKSEIDDDDEIVYDVLFALIDENSVKYLCDGRNGVTLNKINDEMINKFMSNNQFIQLKIKQIKKVALKSSNFCAFIEKETKYMNDSVGFVYTIISKL